MPTVVVALSEETRIADMTSETGKVLDEGAGRISTQLMKECYCSYCEKKDIPFTGSLPSCMQFRMGSAKGMAVLDPALEGRCLETTNSQRKYCIPEPTMTQRVLEVCTFFHQWIAKPPQINAQILRALEPRLARRSPPRRGPPYELHLVSRS